MMDYEYIPATKKTVYLDKQMFATIICMIPAGKLTTLDAICRCSFFVLLAAPQ